MQTGSSPTKRNIDKENIEKLARFFFRNEQILIQKIEFQEKHIKEKFNKLNVLECFSNPIYSILNSKIKDHQLNLMNSKIKNEEVFFNNKGESISNSSVRYGCDYFFYFRIKLIEVFL